MADTLNRYYSGVAFNQNVVPASGSDYVTLATDKYQQFIFPADYQRAGTVTPDITGFQFFVGVSAADAVLSITLEHKPFLGSWTQLGTATSAAPAVVDSEVWVTCLFASPISVTGMEADSFRVKLTNTSGVTHIWYSAPNPLAGRGGSKALGSDATTAILDPFSREVSFLFRLLAACADEGTDFLGNKYRSAVFRKSSSASLPTAGQDTFWMSGPQPSKFAVVSQYFDVQTDGTASVIDRIVIDPITPGMWVHAYYCNDGTAGTTDEEWEERLWIPIPRSYHALRRDTFVLPEPIQARFIKLEYSHLQAKSYSPGNFQRPVTYKKHPKWVLDYFLFATEDQRNAAADFTSSSVTVQYDAFNLAFDYYRDDLTSNPDAPPYLSPEDRNRVTTFLTSRTDLSDQIDPQTRSQIGLVLQPYLKDPRLFTVARTLLAESVGLNDTTNSPVETLPAPATQSPAVSSLDREAVVFEQTFPVMFFYVTCRHRYRLVTASLSHDRAYFAGVREVAFTRERYNVASDTPMYVETLGDTLNSEINDFVTSGSLPHL